MVRKIQTSIFSLGLLLLNFNLTACGSQGSDFKVSSNSTLESMTAEQAQPIYEESDKYTTLVKAVKIGQKCNLSNYVNLPQERQQGIDLKFATREGLEIRLYEKYLTVFQRNDRMNTVLSYLSANNDSFKDNNAGKINMNIVDLAIATGVDTTSAVCQVSNKEYPLLMNQVKAGLIPLAEVIRSHCGSSRTHRLADDAITSSQKKVIDALYEILKDKSPNTLQLRQKIAKSLLPYSMVLADASVADSSYVSLDIGITEGSDQNKYIVMDRSLLDSANKYWGGYLAFVHTSSADKRCDYEKYSSGL